MKKCIFIANIAISDKKMCDIRLILSVSFRA
jgi:hypothetical protein